MGFLDRLKYLILQYVWLMSTNWLHATYQDLQHGAKQTRTRYRMSFSGFSYIFDQMLTLGSDLNLKASVMQHDGYLFYNVHVLTFWWYWVTYLDLGRNMDSLMNTDPESRMYQQLPMSSGLEERQRKGEIKVLKNNIQKRFLILRKMRHLKILCQP